MEIDIDGSQGENAQENDRVPSLHNHQSAKSSGNYATDHYGLEPGSAAKVNVYSTILPVYAQSGAGKSGAGATF
jgi:hypothetical protein